jgi:hypothetical protein
MGRADLIGNGKQQLVPAWQPANTAGAQEGQRHAGRPFRTQHTGLPRTPRISGKARRPGRADQ